MPLLGGEAHRARDAVEHLLAVDADRVQLQVGDRRLDHRRRHAELDERLEVGGHGAREAPDLRAQPGGRDQLHRVPVVLRDAREPRLDAVDAELVEQLRDLELLLRVEHDADGLLAVAERRVVQPDAARRRGTRRSARRSRSRRQQRTTPSGKRRELLEPVRGDEEVVLDPQAAAALPVHAGLDREHHVLLERRRRRPGADRAARARARRRRGRSGARAGPDSRSRRCPPGRLCRARPSTCPACAALERVGVHGQQLLLELGVFGLELAEHEVLRVVGPVAVRADPDLEEHRLALDDGQVATVAVNVLMPLPAQTSENGSASSTSSRAVPCPCT